MGAGANYRDHVVAMAKAFNMDLTTDPKADGVSPWHFIKAGRGTLSAHRQALPYPSHTRMLDWEAELAVVIGKACRNISPGDALDCVAGYTIANDLSARDNLRREQVDASSPFRFDWIGYKCFEGSCPLGPYLTPAAFVASPEALDIKLWVNDELKQNSNTSNHLYTVAEQIAYLSERLTLYPGDVLLTGTPAGVGMESGVFLKRGDSIRVWIDGLGELETSLQ
ncbi:fumarylacetoacetate hydrolase family protein [Cupriavidus necator]